MRGALRDERIIRWLSRGDLCQVEPSFACLHQVLLLQGLALPTSGLAALRFWGQTGERSSTWMAAADPVHFDALLNDLRVVAFQNGEVTTSELRLLCADLQAALQDESNLTFASIGPFAYLRGLDALPTAEHSPRMANGKTVASFLPKRDPDGLYHRLLGEIQLVLHEHEVNAQRRATTRPEINSLWIWGGGVAPQKEVVPVPPLFARDPLFRGYWESCTGVIDEWTGDFNHCLDVAIGDFVVVTEDESLNIGQLRQLQQLLNAGQVDALSLIFRDGLRAELDRFSRLRFWRSRSELFSGVATHG